MLFEGSLTYGKELFKDHKLRLKCKVGSRSQCPPEERLEGGFIINAVGDVFIASSLMLISGINEFQPIAVHYLPATKGLLWRRLRVELSL